MYWKTPLWVIFLSLAQREAGPKRRDDKDYENRGHAEIEERVFASFAIALILIDHFGMQLG